MTPAAKGDWVIDGVAGGVTEADAPKDSVLVDVTLVALVVVGLAEGDAPAESVPDGVPVLVGAAVLEGESTASAKVAAASASSARRGELRIARGGEGGGAPSVPARQPHAKLGV